MSAQFRIAQKSFSPELWELSFDVAGQSAVPDAAQTDEIKGL